MKTLEALFRGATSALAAGGTRDPAAAGRHVHGDRTSSGTSRGRAAAFGLAFFVAHVGLVTAYVWAASSGGTRPIPEPPAIFRGHHHPWHPVLDLLRWDAILYGGIAAQGYASPEDPHQPSHLVCWFPGLPLLARGVHAATGWSFQAALVAVGLACTLGFWMALWSSSARDVLGRDAVAATSALVLAWPGTYVWLAGMTEPLVALLSLLVIVWWAQGHFGRAAALLAFASATKQLFTVMALALAFLRWIRSRPHPARLALELLVSTSGLLAFCAYCAHAFGDPLVWVHMMQRNFGKMRPWVVVDVRHYVRHAETLNGGFALGGVVLLLVAAGFLVPALRRERLGILSPGPLSPAGVEVLLWTLAASTTAFFVAVDSRAGSSFFSTFRYQTANVPLFLLAGRGLVRLPPRSRLLLVAALFALWVPLGAKLTAAYWGWRWVA